MPAESQDHWTGHVDIEESALDGLSYDTEYQMTFKVDSWGVVSESDEDNNVLSFPVVFRASESDC